MNKDEKRLLSETDICDLFITPGIKTSGWDQFLQIRREVTLTPGPVVVRGNLSSRHRHVWMAPVWQGDFCRCLWSLACRVQSCLRPLHAVLMTAGP